jgi:hypothetical protein
MGRLKRRRAKQSGRAEVRIKFALLSSQCKTARESKTSTYMRNIGVRASTCDRYINNKMAVWTVELCGLTKSHPHADIEKLPTDYGGPSTSSPPP